jgi:GntR family transcriptional repressor for pyruvate dehydrogenase complex
VGTEPKYRVLKREPTLAQRATEQLQALIVRRHFEAGDRLPSERELGDLLGVSRTVIREALRSLTAKGLLEVRTGSGTFVRKPSGRVISELLSIFMSHTEVGDVSHAHVHEMRRVLEIEMAGLAAERRDEEDLVELRRFVEEVSRPGISREDYVLADINFHKALARASKNPLFPIVLRSIEDLLITVRKMASHRPEALSAAIAYHTRILAEVEKGSVSGARKAMENHLVQSRELAQRVLEDQAGPKEDTPPE